MNRLRYIVVLLCAMCTMVQAGLIHQPGIVVRGGYHGLMLPEESLAGEGKGYDLGAGFSYRLDYNHLVFLTGLEAGWQVGDFTSSDTEIRLKDSHDSNGLTFDYVYEENGRHDRYKSATLRVPLLVGARMGDVYVAAGVTLEGLVKTWADTRYQLSAYGDYPQFLDPLTGMPEHQFFGKTSKQNTADVQLKQRLYVSAQVGYTVRTIPSVTIAAYADYGVADMAIGEHAAYSGLEPIVTPGVFSDTRDMMGPVYANHLLSTRLVGEGQIVPLTAGVRITLALPQMRSKRYPCMCRDW